MIRYELKDKERQAALEKIFPGFGEALQAACKDEYGDSTNYVEVQLDDCGGIFFNDEAAIYKDAITTKEVYDPCHWNNYPEVTPPEGEWMRVEVLTLNGIPIRKAMFYKGGRWGQYPLDPGEVVNNRLRFRPWNDEEAAK